MIVDTSVVYALLDRNDRHHAMTVEWYEATLPAFTTTPLILAEIDHLAGSRAGTRAQSMWRQDLANDAYEVIWWAGAARESARIAEQYDDLQIGLADASLVALARRLQTVEIATLDERHFRALRPVQGGDAFRLFPLDAS
ncbi:MAG: PIN domain-containing protein [Acidimicrobiia bacterium]|nr:PIN domain-containing protein [Acidimicrobiia bacterium]